MLVGWVSDERYLALAGVDVEMERDGELVAQVRSSASGRDGRGRARRVSTASAWPAMASASKWVNARLGPDEPPIALRLLSDAPLGFVWPRWVRAGEQAELRFHAVEPYRLSLWRYGPSGSTCGSWAGTTSTALGP